MKTKTNRAEFRAVLNKIGKGRKIKTNHFGRHSETRKKVTKGAFGNKNKKNQNNT